MIIDERDQDDEGRECPECLERERSKRHSKHPVWDTEPWTCGTCGYVDDPYADYRDEEVDE